jgi:hypothetical protein
VEAEVPSSYVGVRAAQHNVIHGRLILNLNEQYGLEAANDS